MHVIHRSVLSSDLSCFHALIKHHLSRGLKLSSHHHFTNRSTSSSHGNMPNPTKKKPSRDSISTYVVCGPSGSGKTTLLTMVTSHFQGCFKFCVSHTTRKPRQNEKEGKSYYFVDVSTFQRMVANDEFAEYVQFSGNYYGTSRRELDAVKKSNRIPILDVDIRGVTSLKTVNFDAQYIFVTTPTLEVLERNLKTRGSENEDTLKKRLKHAIEDIKEAEKINFDLVIVNSDLNVAFQTFKDFVQEDVNKLKH